MNGGAQTRPTTLAACDWIIAGALLVVAIGIYARVAHFDFINFDGNQR